MNGVLLSRFERSPPHGFEPRLSQNNDVKIVTCAYLAWQSALVGQGKEQWNEEDQSFMSEIPHT